MLAVSPKSATVLLSGGADSAALMLFLTAQGFEVSGIFINFGQPAAEAEKAAVLRVSQRYGWHVQFISVDTGSDFGTGELIGRNAFLIYTALLSMHGRAGLLALGIHFGTSYYDCSEAFLSLAGRMVAETTDGRVVLVAPFLHWSKAELYRYFRTTGLDFSETYSCESGAQGGCGSCSSCLDREGFGCSQNVETSG